LENHLSADPLGPSGEPSATPRCTSDRNYANFRFSTMDYPKERRDSKTKCVWPSGADRPPVQNQKKNPKISGLVKFIFNVIADHPGCIARSSETALSDI
jgi:hypothetical protein